MPALETPNVLAVVPPRSVVARSGDAAGAYLVGPGFDRLFFIHSPLLALALGLVLGATPLGSEKYQLNGRSESALSLFGGVFTMAHLFAVFFRSHADPSIFRTHRARFVIAPVILFGAMWLSSAVLMAVFVLAVWWDVYHSSLQTFGLGRLYDRRSGARTPPGARSLDKGLNLVLYAGPVFAGAAFADHVLHFRKLEQVGWALFSRVPAAASAHHRSIALTVTAAGLLYTVFYLLKWRSFARAGYTVSRQKVALLASTAVTSLVAWGFNPLGQAFFIMNFFHAWQYFALIGWAERGNIARVFGLARPVRTAAALALFVLVCGGYGIWAKFAGESTHAAFSLLLTVSILHFWYDGFIWSVRRGQVR